LSEDDVKSQFSSKKAGVPHPFRGLGGLAAMTGTKKAKRATRKKLS
jgi:hypothetical protein